MVSIRYFLRQGWAAAQPARADFINSATVDLSRLVYILRRGRLVLIDHVRLLARLAAAAAWAGLAAATTAGAGWVSSAGARTGAHATNVRRGLLQSCVCLVQPADITPCS